LRGALTSQKITKYVEYCLKAGKALGPDNCTNELLKTMLDEEFLIEQAWLNEMLTLRENTINTAHQSQSTLNGTILNSTKEAARTKRLMKDR